MELTKFTLPANMADSVILENQIVEALSDGDVMNYCIIHNMKKIIENALKHSAVKAAIDREVDLYPEKTFYIGNFEVQKKSRTNVDYTADKEYNRLKAAVKTREIFLKANKCNEDGEVMPETKTDFIQIVAK